MHTHTDTLTIDEFEDSVDKYKPLTAAELDRLARECCETDDWYHGQTLVLRVFRAAPNLRKAEAAKQTFKALVNAMQGRDDEGNEVPGGVSEAHVSRLHNELLSLVGIAQGELLSPSPVGDGRIADSQLPIAEQAAEDAETRGLGDAGTTAEPTHPPFTIGWCTCGPCVRGEPCRNVQTHLSKEVA